jgi:hypothetical protein
MKSAFLFSLAAVCLCQPEFASAAQPQVTGKYAFSSVSLCSARIGTKHNAKNFVTAVTQTEGGVLAGLNGYITFKPSAAGSPTGTATLKATQIRGPNTTVDAPATPDDWSQKALNMSGAYQFSDGTFTFGGATFLVSFANVAGGVAHTIQFVGRETGDNPDCLDLGTMSR